MPITTEKRRSPAKPGRWLWIALAVALVILSLPLVLTMVPYGWFSAGGYGAGAFWSRPENPSSTVWRSYTLVNSSGDHVLILEWGPYNLLAWRPAH